MAWFALRYWNMQTNSFRHTFFHPEHVESCPTGGGEFRFLCNDFFVNVSYSIAAMGVSLPSPMPRRANSSRSFATSHFSCLSLVSHSR